MSAALPTKRALKAQAQAHQSMLFERFAAIAQRRLGLTDAQREAYLRALADTHFESRRGEAKLADFATFARRLRTVAIDCRDGIEIVTRYAGPRVAIYLDPPYHPSTRKTRGRDAYKHDLTAADHDRLLVAARGAVKAGAHVAVSGYACEAYDEALRDWRRVDMTATANSTVRGPQESRTESLWMSYPAELEVGSQASLDLRREVMP